MKKKDKFLVGGLTYKIALDLFVIIGLLATDLDTLKMFLLINFIVKIAIDVFAIIRVVKFNKKESELNG